ncbi:hypothetical protein BDW71DRAFT_214984 [Aspergillus fruticulosus]
MPNTKAIRVPHLGGINAAYQMPQPYDSSKPTVVLVNSFTTSSELYRAQYNDKKLTDNMNLLAIELLGHGQIRTSREQWTYWDTAEMNLPGPRGTGQGGWITVMMALLRPDKWTDEPTPEFESHNSYCDVLINIGFNDCSTEVRDFWRRRATIKDNYRDDEGRRRIRMAAITLAERNGLHLRLPDICCPVRWLHGTSDVAYTVASAKQEIDLFTRLPDARLVTVDGGAHFLSCTHPEAVNKALLEFVTKYR